MSENRTFDLPLAISEEDLKMADMLDLSLKEYKQLSHSGLRVVWGINGKPIHYYIMISPLNPDAILEKLRPKMNKERIIYFSAE